MSKTFYNIFLSFFRFPATWISRWLSFFISFFAYIFRFGHFVQPRPEKNLKDSILEATPTPRDIRETKKLNTFMQDLHPHHTQRSSCHQSKSDIVIHPNGIKDQVCTHICQKEHIAEPFFKHFNKVLKD